VFPDVHITVGVPLVHESTLSSPLEQIRYTEEIKTRFMSGDIMFLVYGKINYSDILGPPTGSITAP
jgi:hypothetical protein